MQKGRQTPDQDRDELKEGQPEQHTIIQLYRAIEKDKERTKNLSQNSEEDKTIGVRKKSNQKEEQEGRTTSSNMQGCDHVQLQVIRL